MATMTNSSPQAWGNFKRALLPFVPPPLRGISLLSFVALFDAVKSTCLFLFHQIFFQQRRYTLYVLGYCLVWSAFIYLEIGAVYVVVTVLVGIFANLGSKKKGELSAYSIFNPNQMRLLGESEIVNEILHRPRGARLDGTNDEDWVGNDLVDDLDHSDDGEGAPRRRGKRKKGGRRRTT